jgi:PTS system nitrogen regulatory IIA component
MKSLLKALKDGRLVELPGTDKEGALEFLALLIEAIPDIGTKSDLVKTVLDREAQSSTGMGRGVACPHCRTAAEGELLCSVGWSPSGLDYGAPDGKKVHLVVMYYVPDSQRNAYLKEISGLARAVSADDSIEAVSSMPDIHTVREKLLDWVSVAISESLPEQKARMIKLEARQAAAAVAASSAAAPPPAAAVASRVIPFRLVSWERGFVVLCADPGLVGRLEARADLASLLAGSREFDLAEYRIATLSRTLFAGERSEYEAVAFLSG